MLSCRQFGICKVKDRGERRDQVNRKRFSLILVFAVVLTLFAGTLTVCAADQQTMRINFTSATVNLGDADNKLELEIENYTGGG